MGRPLDVNATATFGPDGYATVEFGPVPIWETWQITSLAVTSDSALMPGVGVYRGEPAPANLLDSTATGGAATTDTVFSLHPGERLTVQWDGGTPGATATAVAQGQRQ